MVKRIIACSDIHFRQYKGIDELKGVLEGFFTQCREIVGKYGKDSVRIAVAGDIFHSKIEVTNESMLAVFWFLSRLNEICRTVVIAGNHDFLMDNKDRVDSLTPIFEMGSLDKVTYLDRELGYKSGILVDDNINWCLYSSFDEFNRPDLSAGKPGNVNVGLIHADINGAVTTTNYVMDKGIDPSIFDGLDLCIAGHIHRYQSIKKGGVETVYCSSISQKDYGETVTEHGFVLWNIEDSERPLHEFVEVENPEGGFYKFELNSEDDLDNDLEEIVNL